MRYDIICTRNVSQSAVLHKTCCSSSNLCTTTHPESLITANWQLQSTAMRCYATDPAPPDLPVGFWGEKRNGKRREDGKMGKGIGNKGKRMGGKKRTKGVRRKGKKREKGKGKEREEFCDFSSGKTLSVLFSSCPRSQGWPHHGRTFSICPLSL